MLLDTGGERTCTTTADTACNSLSLSPDLFSGTYLRKGVDTGHRGSSFRASQQYIVMNTGRSTHLAEAKATEDVIIDN